MQGLEEYGVGKWREISERYLPKWDDQSLRVKAARLLGSQSLARYVGWKGGCCGCGFGFGFGLMFGWGGGCAPFRVSGWGGGWGCERWLLR